MTPRLGTHTRRAILAHTPTDSDTVASFCREYDISRDSYYRVKNAATPLSPQSTAPHNPHTTYPALTWELIRETRASLAKAGYDDGPRSIKWTLIHKDFPTQLIPSTSRISQYLHDSQLTRLNPNKRPHASYKRFQKEFANELWQLDGFEYSLPDKTTMVIIQIVDDSSRYMPVLVRSPDGETNAITLTALTTAIAECGQPREILSDNSRAFTLQRFGMVGAVDIAMAELGVLVTPGPFYHPRNQGKIERSHQPVLNRLNALQPTTLADVDTVLQDFRNHYNHHRQHQGLGESITPAAAFSAATKAVPRTQPIDVNMLRDRYAAPDEHGRLSFEHSIRPLHRGGHIRFRSHAITFGHPWAGHELLIIDKGGWIEFYLVPHGELVATIGLPLPEKYTLNISKHGTFINGNRRNLPHGVESRKPS